MKEGTKLIAIDECEMRTHGRKTLTIGKEYEVIRTSGDWFRIIDDEDKEHEFNVDYHEEFFKIKDEPKDEHYNNDNGSLYLFAEQHELNAWEFDILKRVVRCRKKGQFKDDLEKTKRVIDLYLSEFKE